MTLINTSASVFSHHSVPHPLNLFQDVFLHHVTGDPSNEEPAVGGGLARPRKAVLAYLAVVEEVDAFQRR